MYRASILLQGMMATPFLFIFFFFTCLIISFFGVYFFDYQRIKKGNSPLSFIQSLLLIFLIPIVLVIVLGLIIFSGEGSSIN